MGEYIINQNYILQIYEKCNVIMIKYIVLLSIDQMEEGRIVAKIKLLQNVIVGYKKTLKVFILN